MGRPPAKIDSAQVEALARIGANNIEIAEFFGVNESTIRRRFAEFLTKGRTAGKIRLRNLQWKSAEAGNVAMLIFLGKNLLNQSDKMTTEVSGKDGKPIEVGNIDKKQALNMAEEFLKSNAEKAE